MRGHEEQKGGTKKMLNKRYEKRGVGKGQIKLNAIELDTYGKFFYVMN